MIDPKKIAHRALMEERGCRDCLYFDSKYKKCSLGFRSCILFMERRTDHTGRFAFDKPAHCRNCYWWNRRGAVCRRGGLENCAYLIWKADPEKYGSEPKAYGARADECRINSGPSGGCAGDPMQYSCIGCPYGKHHPCVSFCMRKVLAEWRAERVSVGKEVSVYA